MAVDDTTLPAPLRAQPIVNRSLVVSDAWWPFFQGLIKTLRSAVGSVTEVIDQLNGIWTLSVNSNDRVVGQIKLDGSAALSAFSVLADRFIIVHPSADGTTMQAFIVGLVDGVSTVGINGNLVVDGTILARHISVGSLSAIAVNAGTITAGKLQREDETMIVDLDNKTIVIT